jgi:hypothetical protein
MDTKQSLIEIVKTWIHLDNQLKQMNKTIKKVREDKNQLSLMMIDNMKENNIDIFDLKDGQIRYKTETRREPLSQKRLVDILLKHPQFDEEKAAALNEFVYENRQTFIKESIVRKVNNNTTDK